MEQDLTRISRDRSSLGVHLSLLLLELAILSFIADINPFRNPHEE